MNVRVRSFEDNNDNNDEVEIASDKSKIAKYGALSAHVHAQV